MELLIGLQKIGKDENNFLSDTKELSLDQNEEEKDPIEVLMELQKIGNNQNDSLSDSESLQLSQEKFREELSQLLEHPELVPILVDKVNEYPGLKRLLKQPHRAKQAALAVGINWPTLLTYDYIKSQSKFSLIPYEQSPSIRILKDFLPSGYAKAVVLCIMTRLNDLFPVSQRLTVIDLKYLSGSIVEQDLFLRLTINELCVFCNKFTTGGYTKQQPYGSLRIDFLTNSLREFIDERDSFHANNSQIMASKSKNKKTTMIIPPIVAKTFSEVLAKNNNKPHCFKAQRPYLSTYLVKMDTITLKAKNTIITRIQAFWNQNHEVTIRCFNSHYSFFRYIYTYLRVYLHAQETKIDFKKLLAFLDWFLKELKEGNIVSS